VGLIAWVWRDLGEFSCEPCFVVMPGLALVHLMSLASVRGTAHALARLIRQRKGALRDFVNISFELPLVRAVSTA